MGWTAVEDAATQQTRMQTSSRNENSAFKDHQVQSNIGAKTCNVFQAIASESTPTVQSVLSARKSCPKFLSYKKAFIAPINDTTKLPESQERFVAHFKPLYHMGRKQ